MVVITGGAAFSLAVSNHDHLPGSGGPYAFVSGRHSVMLSTSFLGIVLCSMKCKVARITVNGGLLVHP